MKDVSEQETLPLQAAGVQSAVAFQSFLKQYCSDSPHCARGTLIVALWLEAGLCAMNAAPLRVIRCGSEQYHLEPLQVAVASGVRYLTVWNIERGNPVSRTHAAMVSQGLQRLTGVLYCSPIFVVS